jgi:Holliday junction resolvasome RuvABC endonuclease subunit
MRVLGIDSSTKNGLALLEGDEHRVALLEIPGVKGSSRLQLIAANFDRILEAWQPDIAFIEMYALNVMKAKTTIITIIEIGTIVRQRLEAHAIPWRTIKPSTLKLWVGGPGHGGMNKTMMGECVAARWGFKHPSDDVVDGYALARMGQWLVEADVQQYPAGVEFGFGALPVT